ncbi:unnamed protein product [Psylliodes chrysocephalus]|uniref:Peptidase S1 domain-containing protein n=1 Tax=Psylliodes chrysocephalus TaxID=3402493 RepID=A0A9P0G350_9CUCU|nr:unnamed protein product [Psylliodes chrysocephala]
MFSAKVVIFLAAVALCYGAPSVKLSNKRLNIDGGTATAIEEYPFVASAQWCVLGVCEHVCGAVIVNENWVLTSGSCAEDAQKVAVGASNLHGKDKVTVKIAAKYVHPKYTDGLGPNDVALLQLSEALTFNIRVQPAKLPTQGQEFNGTAVVVGYGSTLLPDFNNLKVSPDVTLISNDECNAAIKQLIPDDDSPVDDDSNVCTLNEKSNTCDGDVGGPLSQDGTVIGIVTWYIDPCGTNGAPNVFTKLSNFANWINQTITENSQIE